MFPEQMLRYLGKLSYNCGIAEDNVACIADMMLLVSERHKGSCEPRLNDLVNPMPRGQCKHIRSKDKYRCSTIGIMVGLGIISCRTGMLGRHEGSGKPDSTIRQTWHLGDSVDT